MAQGVGRALRGVHEMRQALQRKPSRGTYVVFLTASRTRPAATEQHKATLLECGRLSEAVLARLGALLDRFDAAAEERLAGVKQPELLPAVRVAAIGTRRALRNLHGTACTLIISVSTPRRVMMNPPS
jgi:hypothetical protein